jgi:hypothetical protein
MYVIASIERIRELKQEIAALVKLNVRCKTTSHSSDFAFRASECRSLRLWEIREELGAMKRPR